MKKFLINIFDFISLFKVLVNNVLISWFFLKLYLKDRDSYIQVLDLLDSVRDPNYTVIVMRTRVWEEMERGIQEAKEE